jgi:PAS domain S-box-containing protein
MPTSEPNDELLAQCCAILASIDGAVIAADLEGRITFMNPAAEKLTGWGRGDSSQKLLTEVFKIVDEQTREGVENTAAKVIREGAIVGQANHTVLIARDGTERAIDDSAAPMLDASGRIIGAVLGFCDISKRRKKELDLEVSEVRYRRLFESAHDGILILDAKTAKVVDANPFMIELLGYPHEYFLGKELWEIGVFKDAESSKKEMAKLQKVGRIRYENLPLARQDGKHIPVEFVSNVYREGMHDVIQCNIRDITERKHAEELLANANRAAESANRSKSEFLANMSHEMRTPMSAILGFADMLLNDPNDENRRKECARIIRRNALHLLELINEILDLAKIEALQMVVEHITFDLPGLLSDVISLMRPRALEKGLGFGVVFEGAIPRLIQSDPMRLRQILINLLGNAVKFSVAGKIDIRIRDEGAGGPAIVLRIDVIDSGIGIAPELLAQLFQPFKQGDESVSRKFGGTGLGLTISQRLAKLLDGDISVISKVGIGSTFSLKIAGGLSAGVETVRDLTEASLPVYKTDTAAPDIVLSGRILLVEDGHDNQRLLRLQLEGAGATVISAANGKVAVELATTESFDLILMDIQMPVMDGYAATLELRRRGVKIPIIALTAYAMAEDRAKCIANGCDDYLSKPVREETLLKTVCQHLGYARALAPDCGGEGGASGSVKSSVPAALSGTIKSSLRGHPRIGKIIPEFVGGLPNEVRKMTDLLERNDLDQLRIIIHQLRGASGGYGFDLITESAATVDESIRSGKALKEITAEVHSLIEAIRQIEGYDELKVPAAIAETAK